MSDLLLKGRPTARDLLERVGGRAHAFHTLRSRHKFAKLTVQITCMCGQVFRVALDDATRESLRNVKQDGE